MEEKKKGKEREGKEREGKGRNKRKGEDMKGKEKKNKGKGYRLTLAPGRSPALSGRGLPGQGLRVGIGAQGCTKCITCKNASRPARAQLVKHLTVECCSYQMVPGSHPGGQIFMESRTMLMLVFAPAIHAIHESFERFPKWG